MKITKDKRVTFINVRVDSGTCLISHLINTDGNLCHLRNSKENVQQLLKTYFLIHEGILKAIRDYQRARNCFNRL